MADWIIDNFVWLFFVGLFVFCAIVVITRRINESSASEDIITFIPGEVVLSRLQCRSAEDGSISFTYGHGVLVLTNKRLIYVRKRFFQDSYIRYYDLNNVQTDGINAGIALLFDVYNTNGNNAAAYSDMLHHEMTIYVDMRSHLFVVESIQSDRMIEFANALNQAVTGNTSKVFSYVGANRNNRPDIGTIVCPHCSATVTGYIGSIVRCDHCGQNVQIPK